LAIVYLLSRWDFLMSIYVGTPTFPATNYDLRQLFALYSLVETISSITNRNAGRAKGFRFVTMLDRATATAAIPGLQGQALAGRALIVADAKPRGARW
jgi:RNA recognition motif-containing protein